MQQRATRPPGPEWKQRSPPDPLEIFCSSQLP